MDRRTVAARIEAVEPAKVEGRSRLYYLVDVAPFLAARPPAAEGEEPTDYNLERAKLTRVQTQLAQAKLDELNGRLAPVDAFEHAMTEAFSRCRSRLLAIPVKVAPRAVGKNTPEIAEIVRQHVYEALRELAEGPILEVVAAGAPEQSAEAAVS